MFAKGEATKKQDTLVGIGSVFRVEYTRAVNGCKVIAFCTCMVAEECKRICRCVCPPFISKEAGLTGGTFD